MRADNLTRSAARVGLAKGVLGHPATSWSILAIGVAASVALWLTSLEVISNRAAEKLDFESAQLHDLIVKRLDEYRLMLRSGVGLFRATQSVSRESWRQFVENLDISKNYPGIQGVGYSQVVAPAELAGHLAAVRAQGFTDYAIRPTGDRPVYTSILYLEPFDWRNQRAFGFDMYSEPIRREAMDRARDSGKSAVSGIVTLVQETQRDVQKGFLIYMPVYRHGAPIDSVEQRRAALQGFVYSPFRVKDLMRGVVHESLDLVDFHIYDGTQLDSEHMLYEAQPEATETPDRLPFAQVLERTLPLAVGDRSWTLYIHTLPSYVPIIEKVLPIALALAGLATALLLFLYIRSLTATRREALAIAQEMTHTLQQSEQRFDLAMRAANDGLWDWDLATDLVYYSPRWKGMLGYAEGELANHLDTWKQLVDADGQHRTLSLIGACLTSDRNAFQSTFRMRHKAGHWVDILSRGLLIRDPEGKPVRMVGTHVDITAQTQVEQALRDSEAKFRTIIDASPVPKALIDELGNVTYVNGAFVRTFGYTKTDIPTLADWWPKACPDLTYQQAVVQEWRAHLEHSKSSGQPFEAMELQICCKNGETRTAVAAASPIAPSYAGEHLVTLFDITERKTAERRLQESDSRYRSLIEGSPDIVYSYSDKRGGLFYSSRVEAILGYPVAHLLANPRLWNESIHPDDLPKIRQAIQAFAHGARFDLEYRIADRTGRWHWFHDRSIQLRTEADEVITERKNMEVELLAHKQHLEELVAEKTRDLVLAKEAAETANIAKSTFLANMSHEIRTPLNAITGMVRVLQRAGARPEQAERLAKIEVAGKHLLAVINGVLDLSKIEADKLALDETGVRPEELLANVRSILREQAKAKHLALRAEVEDIPQGLVGDPVRLQQALLNYASNAVKFTEHGSITLRVRKVAEDDASAMIRFEVQDTGIGIAPETIQRLFAAFEQADNTTSRRYGGSGLGLTITKRIAELMGGEVGVESIPGTGSTFWFTARLKKGQPVRATPAVSTTEPAEAVLARDYRGRRILLADDEPVNREVARYFLDDVGLVTDEAANGAEAVEWAARNAYDLILMDMQMPTMDGLEASRHIRQTPSGANLPILAMTANAFAEDRARCFDAGMNDFISKPVDPDDLYRLLLNWLSHSAGQAADGPTAGGRRDDAGEEREPVPRPAKKRREGAHLRGRSL